MQHTTLTENEQIIAIRQQLVSNERHRVYWTEYEKQQLREMFASGIGITQMALLLQRSEMAIVNQLNALGLFKKCRAPKKTKKECLCPQCSHYGKCTNSCKDIFQNGT